MNEDGFEEIADLLEEINYIIDRDGIARPVSSYNKKPEQKVMPDCKHKFEQRYDESGLLVNENVIIHIIDCFSENSAKEVVEVINAVKSRKYVGDLCVTCGMMINFLQAVPGKVPTMEDTPRALKV